jgi:transposase
VGASSRENRGSTAGIQPDVRRLERENERQAREIEKLREKLTDRDKKLVEAEKQIADLERQLGLRNRNSTTSSKPPSSDGLAGEQRERGSRRKKSCRKRGGQPGHPGHWRKPVPEERFALSRNDPPLLTRNDPEILN